MIEFYIFQFFAAASLLITGKSLLPVYLPENADAGAALQQILLPADQEKFSSL